MTQSNPQCPLECQQVANEWNLDQLFADLAKYKQQEKPRTHQLSDTEKKCLCLLLSEETLDAIAIKMDKSRNALRNFLSQQGLYYYISQMAQRKVEDWRDVRRFLENDYRTPKALKIKLEVSDINVTVNFNTQSPKLQQFTATINISGWIQNEFEADWQNVEDILGNSHPNRNKEIGKTIGTSIVKRAKILNFGEQLDKRSVVLLVAIHPESNQQVSVGIQLHPHLNETYLPPSLQLTLFSESGKILQEMRSPTHANFMQLPLVQVQPGEKFSLQVALEDVKFIEEFIV